MSDDTKKSTAQEAREAALKLKNSLKKIEAESEKKFGQALRGALTMGMGGLAGAAHEQWGEVDKRTGQKILRLGGVNAGAIVGIGGIVGGLFDLGGKYSDEVCGSAAGVGAQASGDWGRGFVKQLKVRRAERLQEEATKAKESATNSNGAPAQAAAT